MSGGGSAHGWLSSNRQLDWRRDRERQGGGREFEKKKKEAQGGLVGLPFRARFGLRFKMKEK